MRCAWKELLMILPQWLRTEVDNLGKNGLQELRLRRNAPPELILSGNSQWLNREITSDDLNFCINTASRYSPWSAATAASGYITAPGGHRIGLCGEVVSSGGSTRGIRTVTSVCIRVARDFPGIAEGLAEFKGSFLILGAPGWGKTTLLRDLIRQRSDGGEHIAVVDERGELFPQSGEAGCFPSGQRTDILSGCSKETGIEMMLRSMGPECIAVDEITAATDCQALMYSARCGVSLLATAHAASMADFLNRPVYSPLVQMELFDTVVVLRKDKSWYTERRPKWTSSGSVRY